jgi:PAS domain S-box-containing protein
MSWNEGARRIKGYEPQEVIGRHFSIFYPEHERARNRPAMELASAAADGRFEDEGWRVRRDGSLFWANVTITALRAPDGSLLGFGKVTRDLTERRSAEQRAIAEADAGKRAKSDFLAAVSHELRTPLNAIAGYLDLLLLGVNGPLNESQTQSLDRIRLSERHLLGIINDLLTFSRTEAGQLVYDVASISVREAFEAVSLLIIPQAAAQGIRLEVDLPSASLRARGDRMRIEQVLLNLLSNALKFTGAGGTIRLDAREQARHVCMRVTDTGCGIPADRLEDVFEPFVQLGRSLIQQRDGVGLGLAISRDLARAMHGSLSASSIEGEGSVFSFVLDRG